MSLRRELLPAPADFFEAQGLPLAGRGKWRSTRCLEHGGSDSLRVHVASGAHVCMACGVKGGDIIAWVMRVRRMTFQDACRSLGAWTEDGGTGRGQPLPFSARSALEVARADLRFAAVAACNAARGVALTDSDRKRLLEASARLEFIAAETPS